MREPCSDGGLSLGFVVDVAKDPPKPLARHGRNILAHARRDGWSSRGPSDTADYHCEPFSMKRLRYHGNEQPQSQMSPVGSGIARRRCA